MRRVLKHLRLGGFQKRKMLPPECASTITEAITKAEIGHTGQIRIVIEARLPIHKVLSGETARSRAIDIFSIERVWDTEQNNGVLLYLLLAERDAEIIADRGFNNMVRPEEWKEYVTTWSGVFPKMD